MTIAWYGHLKYKTSALVGVIAISWLIALPEYILRVPANRIGHGVYNAAQLKTIQEIISLSVFALFSVYYLGESIKWNHLVSLDFWWLPPSFFLDLDPKPNVIVSAHP